MSMYRLLRSNKEIGPYSLDEIISLGLKPYDLIWVDGKSAAWRYPSEIPELKPYAPVVEEQPYDRFFKRPTPQKAEPLPQEEAQKPAISQTQQEETPSIPLPKTSPIVVVMPKKDKTAVTLIKPKEVTEKPAPVEAEVPVVPLPEIKEEVTLAKELTIKSVARTEVVEMETRMDQSLDAIKERYVQTLLDRKERQTQRQRWKTAGKFALAGMFTGTLGTLIFLTLTNKAPEPQLLDNGGLPEQRTEEPATNTNPVGGIINALSIQSAEPEENANTYLPGSETPSSPAPRNKKTTTTGKETNPPVSENTNDFKAPETPVTQPGAEGSREKKTRADGPRSAEELMRLVSLQANDYKRAAFGGIKDLQLTVSNGSTYVLDQVVVELNYLKPSELPLKTETITFRSVAPRGTMTIKIPDNNRGIKVSYKIKEVVSGELNEEVAKNK